MAMADLNAAININGGHQLISLMDAINGDH